MPSTAHRPSAAGVGFLALSCVGAFTTVPAFAADAASDAPAADADDQRNDVTVHGRRVEKADEPKQVAPLVDTPRSVIVLPSQVIEQTGSTTLQDALRTVPGITFGAAEGGNPIGDRPFIRGFDSQGSIFVDGVRDLGSQTREVFATDSIQVVRGSDSTLGGRGSAGGTINIVSKMPQLDNFGSVNASYGNADYKRVTGDLNLRVGDTAAFRIQGLWHDQNVARRDAIYQKRWGFAPSFTVGLGTPTRLTASYYYLESHELPDSGLPYLYTIGNVPGTGDILSQPALGDITTIGGQTGHVDRSTFYGLKDRDFRDTKTNQATIRVEHDFGEVTLRNTARYTHDYQSYSFLLPDDSQGNVYGTDASNPATAGGQVWRRANTRYGYTESLVDQTDLFGHFNTGSIQHSFSVGTEFSWEKARRGAYVLATGSTINPRCTPAAISRFYCTSLFNPNPSDPWVNYASDTSNVSTPIVKGALYTETQNAADTQSVYGFDSITLIPSLILNLGARYDRFNTTLTPATTGPNVAVAPVSRTDNLFNWQAGLVFKPTHETSVYASYATSATPPNSLLGEGSEGNGLVAGRGEGGFSLDVLKVLKTKSYEVGAKASLFANRLSLGIAGFQTDTKNARVTDENGNVSYIGSTRVRGVELSVNGTILPGWTVFGGYTYLDPIVTDGGSTTLTAAAVAGQAAKPFAVSSVNTGRQIPQTARNSASIWTNVDFAKRFSIGGGAFYMDRVYGGYADNRVATQNAAGVVTVTPATKILLRSVPSYWRFDARASVRLTHNIDLSVNAQNLTNKAYFTQAYSSHYATIAPGRTVFGTIGVKF